MRFGLLRSRCGHRRVGLGARTDDNGAGRNRAKAGLVACNVVDRVGGWLGGIDDDVAGELPVEECFNAEIEVGLRARNRRANVGVGIPYFG